MNLAQFLRINIDNYQILMPLHASEGDYYYILLRKRKEGLVHIFSRWHFRKTLTFVILEGLIIFLSVSLSIFIKFVLIGRPIFSYKLILPKALLIMTIVQICLYYNHMYDSILSASRRVLLTNLFQSITASVILLTLIYYFIPTSSVGRELFLITFFTIVTSLTCWRSFYDWLIVRAAFFHENVLIIGAENMAKEMAVALLEKKDLGYKVVGFLDEDRGKLGKSIVNPKVIGTYADLNEIVEKEGVERVVVALKDRRGKLPIGELLKCKLNGVDVVEGPSFYEHLTGKIMVENLRPSWLIFSEGFNKSLSTDTLKRIIDIFLSVMGLILTAPLTIITVILIKLDSPGPVFFKQKRVGKGEKVFNLFKFRSMKLGAEAESGPLWAKDKDERVTRVGKVIRKLRIDEIPQMINVLKGEMNLIGPRPERPFFVKKLKGKIPHYSLRFSVNPGITGWAQVKYKYGSSVEDALRKLQYDLFYIKNISFLFDFIIILETIRVVFSTRGAR